MPQLPPALVSLISGIELHQSDWWHDAVGRSVTFALWLHAVPQTTEQVGATLRTELGLQLQVPELDEQVQALLSEGQIVQVEPGLFSVSETCQTALVAEIEKNEVIDRAAKDSFIALLARDVSDADSNKAWESFNSDLLIPLITDLGAKTYRFLQGRPFVLSPSPLLGKFLERQPRHQREGFESAVLAFLHPSREEARDYIINRLTTLSFIQASSWPREAVEELAKAASSELTFIVMLDTNLLFSMLDLHENPANEAAAALAQLREDVAASVTLRLFVTNETLMEARAALQNAAEAHRGIVLTPAVVAGTSGLTLSGLGQKFVEQASRADGVRSSADYFGYYVDNLLLLTRERGIELFNADLTPLHVKQEVVDDILSATEVQNKHRRRRGLREKSYEQIRHDVVLWHFVRAKRDAYVESPLQARYWVLTGDYSLLGFDAYKSQRRGQTVPVCLHPTGLIQMLRFWVPRGHSLDAALIRSLRMPFLFFKYDVALEQATLRVLRTLGRFENSQQLSVEAVARLVTSKELRRCMLSTTDAAEEAELVRLELADYEAELRQELVDAHERSQSLAANVAEAEAALARTAAESATLSEQRAEEELRAQRAERRAATARVVLYGIACLTLAAISSALLLWVSWDHISARFRALTAVVAVITALSLALLATVAAASRLGGPDEWEVTQRVRKFNRWLWCTAVTGVMVGVLGNVAYNELRDVPVELPPSDVSTPS
jgi:hypothetical protein